MISFVVRYTRVTAMVGLACGAIACAQNTGADNEPDDDGLCPTCKQDAAQVRTGGSNNGDEYSYPTDDGGGSGSVASSNGDDSAASTGQGDADNPSGLGEDGAGGCGAGLSSCAATCVDLKNDRLNCGTCGHKCGADESCCNAQCASAIGRDAPPLVTLNACGKLAYGKYANQGEANKDNILPDFSYAGYEGGGVTIPENVPVVKTLQAESGDNRARIQAAIDAVAAMPLGANGFRGAVLLKKGKYQIGDTVRIQSDGIIVRGEGQGTDGTIITATAKKQHTAIQIAGSGSGLGEISSSRKKIASAYVGVGSRTFELESTTDLAAGDGIAVQRTPNQAWIDALGMSSYGWTPDRYESSHERKIVAISGKKITIDIPIVDAMQSKYGGGSVVKTNVKGRIRHCGVEDLRIESSYAGDTDEEHGWTAIGLSRTTDSWVRRVTARYFGYSAVTINAGSKFNTVQDTAIIDLKSQISGGRRYPFGVNGGLGNLFQRCYARDGRHNFVTGAVVTGPNVWLDCLAEKTHADDGPHHRWATGLLFDNTSSGELHVQNRQESGSGHGWAGAQVLFWNGNAGNIICDAPKGAMNFAVGSVGKKAEGSWAPEEPVGYWESEGRALQPRSLYLQQLADRLGPIAVERVTVAPQRKGRIWDALRAWAGEGPLSRHL